MRGSVAPADYKHRVLPLIFFRYLSNRFEQRKFEIEAMTQDNNSDWYSEDEETRQIFLEDHDLSRAENVFYGPEESRLSRWCDK
ncbi:type I restriction-modification system subunit M N-terminal domain-containing protein [Peribacillus sp. S4]|uniref:type I restriction-modification system subunit M N-terminal domain-containing protein n=1 Tax=Peribacillus sp. S4 TaxID=3384451 RepID=UPI00398960D4